MLERKIVKEVVKLIVWQPGETVTVKRNENGVFVAYRQGIDEPYIIVGNNISTLKEGDYPSDVFQEVVPAAHIIDIYASDPVQTVSRREVRYCPK